MLKPRLVAPVIAALIALAAAYAYSIAARPGDMLLVQALHGSSAPVRAAATLGLRRFTRCPHSDFVPSTAIGLLVAAWDDSAPPRRVRRLLGQLRNLGCDINERGAQGLAPLHSAILLNNAGAVRLLLQAGADPAVRTRLRRTDGGDGDYDAPAFAARLAATGEENFDAVLAALSVSETPRPGAR